MDRIEKYSETEAKIIKTIPAQPEREEEEVIALADVKANLASLQADLAAEVARHQKEVQGLKKEIDALQGQMEAIEAVGVVEIEETVEIPIEIPIETPIENVKPE